MKNKYRFSGWSESHAYLIGSYLSDGCVVRNESVQNYQFKVAAIDKDYLEAVQEALWDVLGKRPPIHIHRPAHGTHKEMLGVCAYGKDFCDWLETVTGRKARIPADIFFEDAPIKRAVIAGLMDGDGSIQHNRKGQYIMHLSTQDGWLGDAGVMMQQLGVVFGKRQAGSNPKSHNPCDRWQIYVRSYFNAGCYFKIGRKQALLEEYMRTVKFHPSRSETKCRAPQGGDEDIVRTYGRP